VNLRKAPCQYLSDPSMVHLDTRKDSQKRRCWLVSNARRYKHIISIETHLERIHTRLCALQAIDLGGDLTANHLLAAFVASVNGDLAPWFELESRDGVSTLLCRDLMKKVLESSVVTAITLWTLLSMNQSM
jgi:hypothetical protein